MPLNLQSRGKLQISSLTEDLTMCIIYVRNHMKPVYLTLRTAEPNEGERAMRICIFRRFLFYLHTFIYLCVIYIF